MNFNPTYLDLYFGWRMVGDDFFTQAMNISFILIGLAAPYWNWKLTQVFFRRRAHKIVSRLLQATPEEIGQVAEKNWKLGHWNTPLAYSFAINVGMSLLVKVLGSEPVQVLFLLIIWVTWVVVMYGHEWIFGFPRMALGKISDQVLERGRYTQVEAWLECLPRLKPETKKLWQADLLYRWGSPAEVRLLAERLKSSKLDRLDVDYAHRGDWKDKLSQVQSDLMELNPHNMAQLNQLAEQFLFWRRLLQEYDRSNGLELLAAMKPVWQFDRDRLLQSLAHHRSLMQEWPQLFCPHCRTRGRVAESELGRYMQCGCPSQQDMVAGVETLVGIIGRQRTARPYGKGMSFPIWDEKMKQVRPGEVDGLVIGPKYEGNADWALSAIVEGLRNQSAKEQLDLWLSLPKGFQLDVNTLRMLEEKGVRIAGDKT